MAMGEVGIAGVFSHLKRSGLGNFCVCTLLIINTLHIKSERLTLIDCDKNKLVRVIG